MFKGTVHKVLFISTFLLSSSLFATYVICEDEKGEQRVVEIQKEESIAHVLQRTSSLWGKEPKSLTIHMGPEFDEQLDMWRWDAWNKQGDILDSPRVYHSELSEKELEDMRYLITSIAYKTLDEVVMERRELENALERLDHIHPLRFIAACIEDLELRNAMHIIREDKWLWKNFFGKVKKTLNAESKSGSLSLENVALFCLALELDSDFVYSLVQEKQWDAMVDFLYAKYPRID